MAFIENWSAILLMIAAIALVIYFLCMCLLESNSKCIVRSNGWCKYGYGLKDGPHTWAQSFAMAKGMEQSPVNIDTKRLRKVTYSRDMVVRKGYEKMPTILLLQNTGHSVEITSCFANGQPMVNCITQPLAKYELSLITFRWQSEHTIDYRQFPLEIQAIHALCPDPRNTNDESPELLILSYLFAETLHANPFLQPLIMHLDAVRTAGEQKPMQPFPLSWLCADLQSGYYEYSGSLTFPPCTESVTWLISTRIGNVGTDQLAKFGMLCDSKGHRIILNHRPVQPLNGRLISLNQIKA